MPILLATGRRDGTRPRISDDGKGASLIVASPSRDYQPTQGEKEQRAGGDDEKL